MVVNTNIATELTTAGDKAKYDLLSVLMIRLGTDPSKAQDMLQRLLTTVLSSDITTAEKKQIPESEYHIPMTRELQERVNHMCNLSDLIEERGIAKGLERGLEQGLVQGLEQGLEKGLEQGKVLAHINLVHHGIITVSQAAHSLGLTECEFLALLEQN